MNIEIRKTNFRNKGAELMLRSIINKLREDSDDYIFSVETSNGEYIERAQIGLYQKFWIHKLNSRTNHLIDNLIPKKFEERFGVIKNSQIDVILDGSGFSYSDQCGTSPTKRAASLYSYQKKQGKKIILLPQAFGPFEGEEMKNEFKKIVNCVDLIYARDNISYNHIKELGINIDNVKISPDFTNLVSGQVPVRYEHLSNKVCIIPNYRMIDKTDSESALKYKIFLEEVIKYLILNNNDFFILIHDTGKDYSLSREIADKFSEDIEIVLESDPIYIKGIIGQSKFVVGSRYHGLVSSLSQSVPAIAAGWSHKYNMLFKDYSCSDMIIDALENKEEVVKKLDLLINNESRKELSKIINTQSLIEKEKTENMWDEVIKVINS